MCMEDIICDLEPLRQCGKFLGGVVGSVDQVTSLSLFAGDLLFNTRSGAVCSISTSRLHSFFCQFPSLYSNPSTNQTGFPVAEALIEQLSIKLCEPSRQCAFTAKQSLQMSKSPWLHL